MMKPFIKFLFIFILFAGISSCEKEDYLPENYFELSINKSQKSISAEKVSINKGLIVIEAYSTKEKSKSALIITVKGNKEGKYKQIYDYETGVSVTGCGLTYKVISKDKNLKPVYFVSYEGEVKINSIDRERNTINGEYNFKVKSLPDKSKLQKIEGKFINLKIK